MLRLSVSAVRAARASRAVGATTLCLALVVPLPALAIDYLNVTIQPDNAVPSACLTFSTALKRADADHRQLR